MSAFNFNDSEYDMFTNSDLGEFYRSIKTSENLTYIGKYYKVGLMGHRRVVELGDIIELRYERLTEGSQYQVGLISGMRTEKTQVYESSNTVTTTLSIAQGFAEVMKAAISLENTFDVGTSSTKTTSVEFEYGTRYTDHELTSEVVYIEYDYSKLCANQTTVAVGEVVLIARFNVIRSYTEEQNWLGKWKKLSSTELSDYTLDYHVTTATGFIYQKGTGTSDIGYFSFGSIPNLE